MQTGPSRELFELWAPDSRNGLIITGYSVEGTLARVSDYFFHENPYNVMFVCMYLYTKQWTFFYELCERLVTTFCLFFCNVGCNKLIFWSRTGRHE
jgi:Cft2 family RNA processing exonuclease